MSKINIEEYKELVKQERQKYFLQPYDLVYKNFIKLEYDIRNERLYFENASNIINNLRNECWNEFYPVEKTFTSDMLKLLIDEDYVKKLSSVEAITWFVEKFPEHIYALTLSNTQSRRSRAGKEFENIIELVLIGAGIPIDTQASIGKQEFVNKGLGKLVDFVSPGVMQYIINKRNTVLISAKTTLRERWQEVPEEMGRTGAREMFLATLDDNISDDVLNTLYEANIQVVTTKDIKNKSYENNDRVLTFEDLLTICYENLQKWNNYMYSINQLEENNSLINKQLSKHRNRKFIADYYNKKLK